MRFFRLGLVMLCLALSPVLATEETFDFDGFSKLPVLHKGRVKPLDTVARNALLVLKEKQKVVTSDQKLVPVEWLLDVFVEQEMASDYAVLRVDYPDIISGILEGKDLSKKYFSYKEVAPYFNVISRQASAAEALEAPLRSPYQSAVIELRNKLVLFFQLKSVISVEGDDSFFHTFDRLKQDAVRLWPKFQQNKLTDQPISAQDQMIMGELLKVFRQYRFMGELSDLFMVPSPDGGVVDHWRSFGDGLLLYMTGKEMNPYTLDYVALFSAYREGNAALFNDKVKILSERVQGHYPALMRRVKLEVLFNRIEPFYRSMVCYVIAVLVVLLGWLFNREKLERFGFWLAFFGFGIHTVGLIVRMVLQGRPPVTNLYSSAIFVGWVAIIIGLLLEKWFRNGVGSLVSGIVGFSTLIIAHHLSLQGDTLEMMQAVLDSNFWLATHVITITIGYGGMFLAGALGVVYVCRLWMDRSFDSGDRKQLGNMVYGVLCSALLLSFIGTVLGGIWADQSWGRFWGWDPKENGALLIVIWTALVAHARLAGWMQTRGVIASALFGNVITGFSWFGVNMLGIGLHSYGFMDQAFVWLVGFSFLNVALIWLVYLKAPTQN